jgi:energy-coupling factor transporter ATP-binding protein EcfA2
VAEVREAVGRVLERTGSTLVVVEHRVDVWLDLVDRVVVLGADGRLIADGTPDEVLALRGPELAAAGVWVPGVPLEVPMATDATARAADAILSARGLSVGRPRAAVLDSTSCCRRPHPPS